MALLAGCGALALACGETAPPEALNATVTTEGVRFELGSGWVRLRPLARLEGAWRGGGKDGPCTVSGQRLACPVGPAGEASVELGRSDGVHLRFVARQPVTLEGLALGGDARLPGARGWLSNGFQSWSQSGVLALGPPRPAAELAEALATVGDAEVLRRGETHSWWYTFVGGGELSLVAGVLSTARFKSYVTVERGADDTLALRLTSGGTGEAVRVQAGDVLEGEGWQIGLGRDLPALLASYGAGLPSRRRGKPRPAPAGWNSWYELWADVDEASVRRNAPRAKELLGPLLKQGESPFIVVDDGWQERWGDWTPNAKFPSGLAGLAKDLTAAGFRMGVWLAPLLVDEGSKTALEHPEWLLPDVSYVHPLGTRMRILDVTHPEAATHLQSVIMRLVGWGYRLLKIDFLFAGTYEARRTRPLTGMQAYQLALDLIRKAAGEETLLVGVGAPPIAGFGLLDGWRLGNDIAVQNLGPSWFFLPNQARSLAARWHLCSVVLCDADPVLLRTLPEEQVGVGGWLAALAGGALFLSDDLSQLTKDRLTLGVDPTRAALATGGLAGRPEELVPASPPLALANAFVDHLRARNDHVLPALWRLPDGRRVALNFTEAPLAVEGTTVPPRAARLLARAPPP
ncbi:MAG: alpha-galactosidase [Deltaproteobacteria bacterium]|nr:alpha-galactosidase [Deltaproteobacteria bacterium]